MMNLNKNHALEAREEAVLPSQRKDAVNALVNSLAVTRMRMMTKVCVASLLIPLVSNLPNLVSVLIQCYNSVFCRS